MNAVEIEEAITELAEQPFDPAEFPYAFLEAFGNKATTIQRLRSGTTNKSDFHGGNGGSNPLGDAKQKNELQNSPSGY